MNKLVTTTLLGLTFFLTAVALADSEQRSLIFVANYDARLSVSGAYYEVQMQAKVRNGSTFPIDFQNHKLNITVTEIPGGKYLAKLNILELSQNSWFTVNAEPLSFEGSYAAPVEFKWAVGEFSLDLAIAISVAE
jgi:hypothetical protein